MNPHREYSKYHLQRNSAFQLSLKRETSRDIYSPALFLQAHTPFSNLATPTFSRIRISRSKRGGRTDSVSRKPYGITDGWRCLESRAELGWKRYGGGNHRKRDRNLWRDGEEGCGGRKSRPGWDGIWIIESGRSRGRTLNKITWEKRWNKVKEGGGRGEEREKEMGGLSEIQLWAFVSNPAVSPVKRYYVFFFNSRNLLKLIIDFDLDKICTWNKI